MTNPVQIPDAAVQALEALKKAEMFIENGVEYGFIRLPEKPDPALDTLPKIKAAIEALTNEGTKPVDVAAVRERAFEVAATLIDEGFEKKVGKAWRNDGRPSKNDKCPHDKFMYEDCEHCASAAIRALSAEPAQGEQWCDTVGRVDVTIPRTPTDTMMQAGLYHCSEDMQWEDLYTAYQAMFDAVTLDGGITEAAPAAPTPEAEA